METLKNDKVTIKYINDIISANNPVGLIASLKNEEIEIPSGVTEIVLSSLLDNIFNTDKEKWVRIVKSTAYNPNVNNWTSGQRVVDDLTSMLNLNAGSKFDISGLLTQVGDFLGGSSTTGGGSQTTSNSVSPMTAGIVLVVLAAIIGLIIWKA